jgi:hypothetical protein
MVSKDIEAMVIEQFSHEHAENVLKQLERYGSNVNHFEVDRVHSVVLRRAKGDIIKISSLIDLALVDYRDLLTADDGAHKGVALPWHICVLFAVFALLTLLLYSTL